MELRHVLEATSIVLVIEWKWDMKSRRGTKEKPRLWGLNQWAGGWLAKRGADSRALLGYFSCHKMKNKK